jgi:hypothetical protein
MFSFNQRLLAIRPSTLSFGTTRHISTTIGRLNRASIGLLNRSSTTTRQSKTSTIFNRTSVRLISNGNRTPIARITPKRIAVRQWGRNSNGHQQSTARKLLNPILFSVVSIAAILAIANELRARRRVCNVLSQARVNGKGLVGDLRRYWNQLPAAKKTIYTLIALNAVVFAAWQIPSSMYPFLTR